MTGDSEETNTTVDDAATESNDEESAQNGLQEDDFVRLSYTARTVDDDALVDTTDEEVAEEEGVAEEGTFEPRVIVLGSGHIFESVEEDIMGRSVGETGSVVVPASEAFGEYDQDQVRTVSVDKIPEDDRYPGAEVQIDNQQGYLETIIGGRARVDFNHMLAGEDIEYEYEIVDVVDDTLERANGLMNMFFDLDLDMDIQTDEVEEEQPVESDAEDEEDDEAPEYETVTVEKETLYIESTPQLSMNQQWLFQKQQIAQQLIDLVGIDRVIVQEILDGQMGGMGMPGMMGGAGGAGAEIEDALEEADIDADDVLEEMDEELDEDADNELDEDAAGEEIDH